MEQLMGARRTSISVGPKPEAPPLEGIGDATGLPNGGRRGGGKAQNSRLSLKMGRPSAAGGFWLGSTLLAGNILLAQTQYDLTSGGSVAIDGTYFFPGQSSAVAGSGAFGPFVRLQNNVAEQGYNSASSPVMSDVKNGINFRFANFRTPANPAGKVNGVSYYSFALDINEGSSTANRYVSLDKLQFYVRATDFTGTGTDTADTVAHLTSTSTLVYDLDASSDKTLLLDGGLVGGGSSTIDLIMLIPQSVFAPYAGSKDNIFLLFQMGATGVSGGRDYSSDSGFEEWNAVSGLIFTIPAQVPEPGTWGAIAVMTLAGVATWRSQKAKRQSLQDTSVAAEGHRIEDSVTGTPPGSLGPCPR